MPPQAARTRARVCFAIHSNSARSGQTPEPGANMNVYALPSAVATRSCARLACLPRLGRRALLSLAFAVVPTTLFGGQVRGKVVDPGNEPLPGVTLSLQNELTGFA